MSGLGGKSTFSSEIGKTRGALQPSEFWYFWRRFIPNDQPRQISAEEEAAVDVEGFRKGVAALEKGLSKPFAAKGMILQYNLPLLYRIFPKALFLFVRRDPLSNIRSLLAARERHTGDRSIWFSVKPPGWEALRELSPERQVAGQVLLTNRHIERSLQELPAENHLSFDYEDLCKDPACWLARVIEKAGQLGVVPHSGITTPGPFEVTNNPKGKDFSGKREIEAAISWFHSQFTEA